MQTIIRTSETQQLASAWQRTGHRVALVPTMGNLHQGHLDLVAAAKGSADKVIATIFVNPLQFGPNEDFSSYPRTFEEDQMKLEAAGCDLLFAPNASELFPNGQPIASLVRVQGLSDLLDGHFRPGFFEGVATIVNILFNITQPDMALFGEKDWQQLQVVKRMVSDLHLPIKIIGVPTRREDNGLAMSSRNSYLRLDEREKASKIIEVLRTVGGSLQSGQRNFVELEKWAETVLSSEGFRVQYVNILKADLSEPTVDADQLIVLVAAFLGQTRLIDNLLIKLEP